MSFDWREYRDLAYELQSPPRGDPCADAKRRTSVSRAYYAAYHHALEYYRQKYGRVPRDERQGSHEALAQALIASEAETEAGDMLAELKSYRHAADYHDDANVDDFLVMCSLTLTDEILDSLQ